jgi:hypothetical protein
MKELAGGLVRGPVHFLARPAAVLDGLARTALVADLQLSFDQPGMMELCLGWARAGETF